MSTDLIPPIPTLSEARLDQLQAAFISEVTPPSTRRKVVRRTSLAGSVAVVSGVVVAVVLPGSSPAFASWTATPTAAPPAISDCKDATGTPVLAEKRGDYTLTVVASSSSVTSCLVGDGFQQNAVSSVATKPAADTAVIDLLSASDGAHASVSVGSGSGAQGSVQGSGSSTQSSVDGKGRAVTFLEGQAGSDVTAVSVVRADGSTVKASVKDGWFAAWWPGSGGASKLVWTTSDGQSHSEATPTATLPALPPLGGPHTGPGAPHLQQGTGPDQGFVTSTNP